MKRKVQNPARLLLFFSFYFVLTLALAVILRFFELRTGEFRIVPGLPAARLPEFITSLRWGLGPALYLSILLSLSYTVRRNFPTFLSIFLLFVLSMGAVLGFSWGIERLREIPVVPAPATAAPPVLGKEKGLILSQPGMAVVLLQGRAEPRGARVVSLPGEPLIYQEVPLGPNSMALPPLSFRNETTPFLTSLVADFALSARQLESRLEDGFLSLLIYASSLVLLLVSLRFIFDTGNWPLTGVCLGVLAFRGILSLETFLNTPEVQVYLASFLGKAFPPPLISPLAFTALGLLILLYTALVSLVKVRRAANG